MRPAPSRTGTYRYPLSMIRAGGVGPHLSRNKNRPPCSQTKTHRNSLAVGRALNCRQNTPNHLGRELVAGSAGVSRTLVFLRHQLLEKLGQARDQAGAPSNDVQAALVLMLF